MNLSVLLIALSLTLSGCSGNHALNESLPYQESNISAGGNNNIEIDSTVKTSYELFNENTSIKDVIEHEAFQGFGRFLFPIKNRNRIDNSMRLNNIDRLLPYHSAIQTETTVGVLNYLLDEIHGGNTVFYDIYTDEEKRTDKSLEDTGLFFFRGEPGAPFAIVCAGGGFSYVGSIHESFPHALELSKAGYNAFAIEYRTGDANDATKDLAAAISFIFNNAETLGVSTEDYSV